MDNKKLSIIVPNYNNEQFLNKSLDSLINQSYDNLEIIVVNDGSKGNCDEIVKKFQEKDKRIKYVKHDTNKGLFQARLTGAENATGDYIAFLDADDYVSIDFYRTMMYSAMKNDSDIVMSNLVLEYDDGTRELFNLMQTPLKEINGKDCFKRYMEQDGLNYSWSVIWNKIYKMEIWKKAAEHYKKVNKRLIMTEDIAFSTVLFYFANRVNKVNNDVIFYCQHQKSSTSTKNMSYEKIMGNITDLNTSFGFIEQFLKDVKAYDEYKEDFILWKSLYYKIHYDITKNMDVSKAKKDEIIERLNQFCPEHKDVKDGGYFYSIKTTWNEGLEEIKKAICDPKVKCVSFDIFDTLVVRPFWYPTDLFTIVDKQFRKITGNKTGIDFTNIRVYAERLTREKKAKISKENEEITLDEIYETLHSEYNIDNETLEKIKQIEIESELRFCTRRMTGFELYELALAKGKRVICTSDMYLPQEVIKKILEKNKYTDISKIYLSADYNATKWNKTLYKVVLNEEKLSPEELIHIGDNYESDFKNAKKAGINAKHLPMATNVFMDRGVTQNLAQMFMRSLPHWRDNVASMEFVGIRSMLAIVANKYFDNPYRSFNNQTDFNADPYLIGYYALGMYMFGLTKWILDDVQNENYENMVFMARDGYLPMKCYEIVGKYYNKVPEAKYLYVSRKALVPITIQNELDFYKMSDQINMENHTPIDAIKYIKNCIKFDDQKFKKVCQENKIKINENFKTTDNFNRFISIVIDNFYDKKEQEKNLGKLKEYFKQFYGNHSATFDIGYSARPEMFLSNLLGTPIDTYFSNINKGESIRHQQIGGFKLKTFFDGKPTTTGHAYEMLLSALAPSCIGYNITENGVEPVFEEYSNTYAVRFAIETIQQAAMDFVTDIVNIYKEDMGVLYYQNYYISLPYMAYLNSSREIDKAPFASVRFEDGLGLGDDLSMVYSWTKDLSYHNQATMDVLYSIDNDIPIFNRQDELIYNSNVDLTNRNKFVRLIYYMLFDKDTFKRRIGNVCYKNKLLWKIYRKINHI